jgi:N-acetylneuraminic acid mutarotase
MYMLSGNGENSDTTASVLKFDSVQGTWSQITPMPEARWSFAACAVGSDIYVFGGFDSELDYRPQASVFKLDTVANDWNTLALMPRSSCVNSASVVDGLICVVGSTVAHCFDPLSGDWSTIAPTITSRFDAASFALGGCVYVAGGSGEKSSVERYDPASDTWSSVANMLEGRDCSGAVTVGSSDPVEEQDLFDSLIANNKA